MAIGILNGSVASQSKTFEKFELRNIATSAWESGAEFERSRGFLTALSGSIRFQSATVP
jgi:hypothetical protein